MKKLARELVGKMPQLTATRHSQLAIENTELNQPYIRQTVMDLAHQQGKDDGQTSAIVISGGPSLHQQNSVARIAESGYQGKIISVDGALGHCLRSGLIPDYVVTADPNRTRVVRWFGDPGLESPAQDDYFRRQEMDPYMASQEVARNREQLELVNKFGPRLKAVISTSASAPVTKRCLEAGMELYWWNPVYDDFDAPDSLTKRMYQLNKVPCMVSGGNVGTAAWVFGHSILGIKDIALVGMDFSYTPGTPPLNTQYGKEILELFGESAQDAFIDVRNPHLKETWFTDPAYYWYRQAFLEMALQADCRTFNCTEGGILFGKKIKFTPLQNFLSAHNGANLDTPQPVTHG
ncbi:DUF115 domain-containing protein [Dehalococcoidia bacterium]|nr:DUF115 domain-containing protein [Dehalococcoidia bacterium]